MHDLPPRELCIDLSMCGNLVQQPKMNKVLIWTCIYDIELWCIFYSELSICVTRL